MKVKADIYSLMDDLRRKGKSIIMISEEIQEAFGYERSHYYHEGRAKLVQNL